MGCDFCSNHGIQDDITMFFSNTHDETPIVGMQWESLGDISSSLCIPLESLRSSMFANDVWMIFTNVITLKHFESPIRLVVWNIIFFPYIGHSNPNWLSYVSEGLKPPTSFELPIYCWNVPIYCWNERETEAFTSACRRCINRYHTWLPTSEICG